MAKIICIGSGAKDVFFPLSAREIKIIDNPDDVTAKKLMAFEYGAKFRINDRYEAPGGCAANASQGLARLGLDVFCYCRIGNDADGKWMEETLQKENVKTDFIQHDQKFRTDLSCILVNEAEGDRTIFYNRDANEKLEVKIDDLEADWIFMSALNGNWEKNLDVILRAMRAKEIKLAYNPGQENIKDNPEKIKEVIAQAEILFVNRDEATEIVNKNSDEIKVLIQELLGLGAKIVVLTDGKDGAYASDVKKTIFAEAQVKKAMDTTGAGDAFSSGFLAAYIKGKSLEECLQWGTANGGNSVKFYGGVEGLLRESEIEDRREGIEVKIA
jgi:sugar/nucleoside kinase (ribokinase family)